MGSLALAVAWAILISEFLCRTCGGLGCYLIRVPVLPAASPRAGGGGSGRRRRDSHGTIYIIKKIPIRIAATRTRADTLQQPKLREYQPSAPPTTT